MNPTTINMTDPSTPNAIVLFGDPSQPGETLGFDFTLALVCFVVNILENTDALETLSELGSQVVCNVLAMIVGASGRSSGSFSRDGSAQIIPINLDWWDGQLTTLSTSSVPSINIEGMEDDAGLGTSVTHVDDYADPNNGYGATITTAPHANSIVIALEPYPSNSLDPNNPAANNLIVIETAPGQLSDQVLVRDMGDNRWGFVDESQALYVFEGPNTLAPGNYLLSDLVEQGVATRTQLSPIAAPDNANYYMPGGANIHNHSLAVVGRPDAQHRAGEVDLWVNTRNFTHANYRNFTGQFTEGSTPNPDGSQFGAGVSFWDLAHTHFAGFTGTVMAVAEQGFRSLGNDYVGRCSIYNITGLIYNTTTSVAPPLLFQIIGSGPFAELSQCIFGEAGIWFSELGYTSPITGNYGVGRFGTILWNTIRTQLSLGNTVLSLSDSALSFIQVIGNVNTAQVWNGYILAVLNYNGTDIVASCAYNAPVNGVPSVGICYAVRVANNVPITPSSSSALVPSSSSGLRSSSSALRPSSSSGSASSSSTSDSSSSSSETKNATSSSSSHTSSSAASTANAPNDTSTGDASTGDDHAASSSSSSTSDFSPETSNNEFLFHLFIIIGASAGSLLLVCLAIYCYCKHQDREKAIKRGMRNLRGSHADREPSSRSYGTTDPDNEDGGHASIDLGEDKGDEIDTTFEKVVAQIYSGLLTKKIKIKNKDGCINGIRQIILDYGAYLYGASKQNDIVKKISTMQAEEQRKFIAGFSSAIFNGLHTNHEAEELEKSHRRSNSSSSKSRSSQNSDAGQEGVAKKHRKGVLVRISSSTLVVDPSKKIELDEEILLASKAHIIDCYRALPEVQTREFNDVCIKIARQILLASGKQNNRDAQSVDPILQSFADNIGIIIDYCGLAREEICAKPSNERDRFVTNFKDVLLQANKPLDQKASGDDEKRHDHDEEITVNLLQSADYRERVKKAFAELAPQPQDDDANDDDSTPSPHINMLVGANSRSSASVLGDTAVRTSASQERRKEQRESNPDRDRTSRAVLIAVARGGSSTLNPNPPSNSSSPSSRAYSDSQQPGGSGRRSNPASGTTSPSSSSSSSSSRISPSGGASSPRIKKDTF